MLLLDRDRFPSDMGQSTHLIHPLGVAHLRAWGVLPQIAARATPFTDWRVDLHGTVLQGAPPAVDGHNVSHGPRRKLLDGVLAEAAVAAAAEFRDGVRVVDLVEDGGRVAGVVIAGEGGARHVEHARLVIGADGPGSVVARTAGAVRLPRRARRAEQHLVLLAGDRARPRAGSISASAPAPSPSLPATARCWSPPT